MFKSISIQGQYIYFREYHFTSLLKNNIYIDSEWQSPRSYEIKIKLTVGNNENFWLRLLNESTSYYSGWIQYD